MKYYKKTFKFIWLLLYSSLIFFSCNKETIENTEDTSVLEGKGLTVIDYKRSKNSSSKTDSNKSSFNGTRIAVFSDELAYENYTEALENQVQNLENAFLAQWGHLNDDDLNAKEDELNFDSEKPLSDFENQIGLQSLRKQYLMAEEAWLNNDVLDSSTDPDSKPIYDFEDNEMAVMNTLAEVQIGTTIIKKLNLEEITLISEAQGILKSTTGKNLLTVPYEDKYLVIQNSDYDALIDFNNGDVSVINNPNVTVTNNPPATSCKYAKEVRKDFLIDSKKFFRAVIKVPRPSLGWNGKVKAKIVSYKKGFFGWRKWRTKIDVGARGDVFNTSCDNSPTYVNKWKGVKRKKKRIYIFRDKSFGSHKVENGGMTGLYRHNNVIKELNLTW